MAQRGERLGLALEARAKRGVEAFVQQYRVVREECLIKSLDTELNADIGELARLLRTMSGLYDQAARSASAM